MKYNEIKLVWHLAHYVLTFTILRTSTPQNKTVQCSTQIQGFCRPSAQQVVVVINM